MAQDLHRLNLVELSKEEKLAFFLNLYNAMVIHALIRIGRPEGMIARRSFFTDFQYVVGGYSYSLSSIRNDILRGRRPSYPFIRPSINGKTRHEVTLEFPGLFDTHICDFRIYSLARSGFMVLSCGLILRT